MEKKGTRLFQLGVDTDTTNWNIVELESRRQLRQKVNELIQCSNISSLTTSEIQQQLLLSSATFGNQLAAQLVRSLQSNDQRNRQSLVWLLTMLDDKSSIPLLQHLAQNELLSRSIRLSASLALAGMGATAESTEHYQRRRLYAIS